VRHQKIAAGEIAIRAREFDEDRGKLLEIRRRRAALMW